MAKNNRLETWGYNKGYIEKQKQRELKRLERRRRRKEKRILYIGRIESFPFPFQNPGGGVCYPWAKTKLFDNLIMES